MWKGFAPTHKIWVVKKKKEKKKRWCHNSYPASPKRTIHSFLLNKMLGACFSSDVAPLSLSKMCLTKYNVYRRKNILKKKEDYKEIWCCTNLLIFYTMFFLIECSNQYLSVFIRVHWNQHWEANMQLLSLVFKWSNFCCFVSVPMLIDISLKGMSGKTSDLCRSLPMSSKMSTGLLIFI